MRLTCSALLCSSQRPCKFLASFDACLAIIPRLLTCCWRLAVALFVRLLTLLQVKDELQASRAAAEGLKVELSGVRSELGHQQEAAAAAEASRATLQTKLDESEQHGRQLQGALTAAGSSLQCKQAVLAAAEASKAELQQEKVQLAGKADRHQDGAGSGFPAIC